MPFHKVLRTENLELSKNTQNSSFITQHLKVKYGFTLIEFLVMLGILAIVVGSSLLFLTSLLRGSNEANVTAEVKQNGQAVLDSLERQIRNAIDAQVDGPGKYIKLIRTDGDPLHIQCFSDTTGPKSENGWVGTVVSSGSSPSQSSYVSLTNKDTISGVDIVNCSFSVRALTTGAASPPIVSMSFVINQGIKAPSRADFLASAQFQTTISLRGY